MDPETGTHSKNLMVGWLFSSIIQLYAVCPSFRPFVPNMTPQRMAKPYGYHKSHFLPDFLAFGGKNTYICLEIFVAPLCDLSFVYCETINARDSLNHRPTHQTRSHHSRRCQNDTSGPATRNCSRSLVGAPSSRSGT